MALKEAHGGRSWVDWAPELRRRDRDALAAARAEHAAAIEDKLWQHWFDRQWSRSAHANAERGSP
jgi:4-alpha-glucanotransferase